MDEERLRKTLKREPQAELSPFFAARVANIARAEQKARQRRVPPILLVYWGLLLVASLWAVGTTLSTDLAYYLLLALVPLGFAAAVFWQGILAHFQGLLRWLFGHG